MNYSQLTSIAGQLPRLGNKLSAFTDIVMFIWKTCGQNLNTFVYTAY